MDHDQHLIALRRDGDAFVASARVAGLTAVVPSCPRWTVADLVWHLAEVDYFWGSVVQQKAAGWDEVVRITRPGDVADLFGEYEARFAHALDVLASADPTSTVWTWSEDHSAGFVMRRLANETAMHLWDVNAAAGTTTPIEATLASDGIDEFLSHFVADISERAQPVGGSVHIHCTDVAGEWTIRPTSDGFSVTREHAKGDCALRGSASDILLALWRRALADSIEIIGDAGVASRFLASANLD